MSLNADVMDDIEKDSVIDNDIIQQSTAVKPNSKPINIIAKTNNVSQDVTDLSEADKQTLPAMDVSFNVIKDNVSKVIELQDVENDILAQESINRSSAELVNDVFPGLLGHSIRLEEFTHKPSKTNYSYVKKHMKDKISVEQINTITSCNDFINKPLEDAKAVLSKLSTEYIDSACSRFSDLFYRFKDLEFKLKGNKNLVVQINNEFVNLTNVDLFNIDYDSMSFDIKNRSTLTTARDNLKQLFNNKGFKSFILGSLDNKPATTCFTNESVLEYGDTSINILDLCKMFSTSTISDNLSSLKEIAASNIETIENIKNEYSADRAIDNFDQVNEFLIKNNGQIQTFIKSVQTVCSIVLSVNNLSLNAEPLLDFYDKM